MEWRLRPRDLVVPLLCLQLGQLVLGARAKARDVKDSVYSSVYSVVCGGVDSRMASVCSNLSVEISCDDVTVAWSLPPACDSAVENCKSNQIQHVFMNTKNRSTNPGPRQAEKPELRKSRIRKPGLRKPKQKKPSYESSSRIRKPGLRKPRICARYMHCELQNMQCLYAAYAKICNIYAIYMQIYRLNMQECHILD